MSVEIGPNEIKVASGLDIELTAAADVDSVVDNEVVVEASKKEYSIVGDALYAGISSDEAPQWLLTLIDTVVAGVIAGKVSDLQTAIESINNSLLELDVAKNQYQELINIESTIDGVIASKLETLNATVQQNSANIINLDIAKAGPDEALAIAIEHVNAQINGGDIYSLVTDLKSAYADKIGAAAAHITSVETVFNQNQSTIEQVLSNSVGAYNASANAITDLKSTIYGDGEEVLGIAKAQENLSTYVGYTTSYTADIPTQLLDQKSTLENQITLQTDKAISYWFQDSTVDPASTVSPNGWFGVDNDAAHYGDLWYKDDLGTAHRYSSGGWVEATAQEKKLLDDISSNKKLADTKVTIYKYDSYISSGKPVDATTGFPTPVGIAGISKADLNSDFEFEENDLLILTYEVEGKSYTDMYEYTGTEWNVSGGGLVARSNWAVDLEAWLNGTGSTASYGGKSSLTSTLEATEENVRSNFQYTSKLVLGGVEYNTGFGLATSATSGSGLTGTDSEFWINAEKFKMTTPSHNDIIHKPFTIDGSGDEAQIAFNGKVTFSNTDMSAYENSGITVPTFTSGAVDPTSVVEPVGSVYHNTTDDSMWTYTDIGWVAGGNPDALVAEDLGPTGTTVIDGGRITTGIVDADRIFTEEVVIDSTHSGVIHNGSSAGATDYTMKIDFKNGSIYIA